MASLVIVAGILRAGADREVYAHYMGCFPAGTGGLAYSQRMMATNLMSQADYTDIVGGRIVNWPLLPQRTELTAEANAELEIRRAMRAGIDGFAFDAWAGGDGAKKTFEIFLHAAEKMQVPFKLTICFDPSCHPRGKSTLDGFVDTAKFVLQFRDSPNLARRDGKALFFTYHAPGIIPRAERPVDDLTLSMKNIGEAWAEFRKRVGEPVFLHGCLETLAESAAIADRKTPAETGSPPRMRTLGEWAGRTFDAVGGFLANDVGRWRFDTNLVAGVKAVGGSWSQPLFWQYDNKAGGVISGAGLDLLRENWEAAMKTGATLLQFVTWNDYGEESILAPAYGSNYTVSRVNRYYADWWKTGEAPAVTKDELHVVFRKYRTGDEPPVLTYPFAARTCAVPDMLEVIVFAKAPGRVVVPGYGEYDVLAGMSWKQFPLKPGRVEVSMKRGIFSRKTVDLAVPEAVSDKPWREDFTQVAYGSNFASEWALDFGNAPPLAYGEYGDIDGDGLPNGFEMLHAGQFPFMDTATNMSDSADPDGDGATNLQEFQNRTNPLVPETPYAVGDAWRFTDIATSEAFFNPTRDAHGAPVWWVFYKFGERQEIALDGNYLFCRSGGGAARRKDISTPYDNPHGYGTSLVFGTNGTFRIGARQESVIVVGWKSPIDGVVDFEMETKTGSGHGTVRLILAKSAEAPLELASRTAGTNAVVSLVAHDVEVRKGDFLYFIPDYRDAWGLGACEVSRLEVTLKK
jgi:hypothetical protein